MRPEKAVEPGRRWESGSPSEVRARRGRHLCFVSGFCVCLFRATPPAYGGSQARGQIGAVASGLWLNQSNVESRPRLQPTPQPTAVPDP